jgi:CRISPR-associated protein Csh2
MNKGAAQMSDKTNTLSGRREFLFLYDIKMGNPNGDPDENRPRVLPDGTHYVTDVRLKRFVRDFMKSQGLDILVDNVEGRVVNLAGRVVDYLNKINKKQADGRELVEILLAAFIDARLFGSALAFKAIEDKESKAPQEKWAPNPEPKTLTGPVQIHMGEILHQAEEIDIHGTSIFSSKGTQRTGTFTTYFGLRYALIGFSGVANEHSAKISGLTDADYDIFLQAMWHGVRSAGNTRTKVGQMPHLLISLEYKPEVEFQFGRLHDYVKLTTVQDKAEKAWSSPQDFQVDLGLFLQRVESQKNRLEKVRYYKSEDIQIAQILPDSWQFLDLENITKKTS